MQKKLIALAIAGGLVSVPAFAQSNVQIYGIIDLGITHQSGSQSFGGAPSLRSRSAVDDSGSATSRIGFRGTEDLGNGLKAFFTVENALNPDTDSSFSAGNRQAFVGLEGGFGRVWLGRDFNPARAFLVSLDPFGATGYGSARNIIFQQDRFDNGIYYRTPNFGGFTVTGAYSQSVAGDEEVRISGESNPNARAYSITPVYKNGPLTVGGSYDRIVRTPASPAGNAIGDTTKRWNLGAGYDFGVADVRVAYSQTKYDGLNLKSKAWLVGGVIPVSEQGNILASFNQNDFDGDKARQYAIGYLHNLSKRTALYTTYSKVTTSGDANGVFGVSRSANIGTIQDDLVAGSGAMHTSGFAVGVRHSF